MRAGALSGVLYGLLEKNPDRRWDVETARSVLRELLIGPLASNPTTHFTDPYAVVRPAPFTPPTAPPSGQIGGRALLAPGESITDAMRRRGEPDTAAGAAGGPTPPDPGLPAGPPAPAPRRPVTTGGTGPAGLTETGGMAISGLDVDVLPTGKLAGAIPTQPVAAPGDYRPAGGRHAAPDRATGRDGSGNAALTAVAQAATSVTGAARPAAERGIRAFRGASPLVKVAGIAACVVLLLLVALGVRSLIPSAGPVGQQKAMGAPTPAGPTFPTQEHRDPRGFVVNVPKDWTKRQSNSSFVDYVDPKNNDRRLRLNIEAASGTATSFAQVAEDFLQRTNGSCTAPYNRVGLRDGDDIKLGGQKAAELEYTCGSGGQARHGIWRVTVQNGKAYQFFLTVPDNLFATSKPIYDEMVRSYRFGA
jgi:hypothetical protein